MRNAEKWNGPGIEKGGDLETSSVQKVSSIFTTQVCSICGSFCLEDSQ